MKYLQKVHCHAWAVWDELDRLVGWLIHTKVVCENRVTRNALPLQRAAEWGPKKGSKKGGEWKSGWHLQYVKHSLTERDTNRSFTLTVQPVRLKEGRAQTQILVGRGKRKRKSYPHKDLPLHSFSSYLWAPLHMALMFKSVLQWGEVVQWWCRTCAPVQSLPTQVHQKQRSTM